MRDKLLTEADFGITENTIRPDLDKRSIPSHPQLSKGDERNRRLTASDFGITADMKPPSMRSKHDHNSVEFEPILT